MTKIVRNLSPSKKKLPLQNKESLFLLSIGTFLEYFDLMLYTHMAILLNPLFFPQGNSIMSRLLEAFIYCLAFIFRPLGGFIIGWLGDKLGRKATLVLTSVLMAMCCITMATTKTYAEIGLAASFLVSLCRILQGIASMGEKVGAQIYLTESFPQPTKYIYGGLISVQAEIGGFIALLVASLTLIFSFNWRVAFWVGALIAIIGLIVRVRLRETPEFLSYLKNLKVKDKTHLTDHISINYKAIVAYFFIRFLGPPCFYITYVSFAGFMKEHLNFTEEEVIYQNARISILTIICMFATVYLAKKHHPIKVAKIYIIIFSLYLPFMPYLFTQVSGLVSLTCLQLMIFFPALCMPTIEIVCFKYIPVAKRFTCMATSFGLAAAISFLAVSFSMIFLVGVIGYYAIIVIYIPIIVSFIYSINYIKNLEQKRGLYHNYPTVHHEGGYNL